MPRVLSILRSWSGRAVQVLLVPLGLIGLWYVVTAREMVDPVFLPRPGRVVDAARQLADSGVLLEATRITLGRALVGWLLASVAGVVVAVVVTRSRSLVDAVAPPLDFLRSLPAAAVIPPATLLLGYGRSMEVSVIVFAAIWPVLLNSMQALVTIEPQLREMARSIRLSRTRQVLSIELPSAVPFILLGARTGLSIAMIVAVVAEMVASTGGLGHELIQASRRFRSADVYAYVIVLGAVGAAANGALHSLEHRILSRAEPAKQGVVEAPAERVDTPVPQGA